jgi:hypothetical protein
MTNSLFYRRLFLNLLWLSGCLTRHIVLTAIPPTLDGLADWRMPSPSIGYLPIASVQ